MTILTSYLDVLRFLSTNFCNFQYASLTLLLLNLYLSVLFLLVLLQMKLFSYFVFGRSLLLYENTIDFCVFILYPDTLLNLFFRSCHCSPPPYTLEFLYTRSVFKYRYFYFFLSIICMPFISSFCFIALPRTSNTC